MMARVWSATGAVANTWTRTQLAVTALVLLLLTTLTLVNMRTTKPGPGPVKAAPMHAHTHGDHATAWADQHLDLLIHPTNISWSPHPRPRIILFGDSLTEQAWKTGGWACGLADLYGRRLDVINRGFSGYNTKFAVELLDDLFHDCTEANTPLVTVFFGANDAGMPLPHGSA
jgi:hypothetical protein